MTYQPYEAAGTQTTVPPTGYGTPYAPPNPVVTQPGSAGWDFGPFTPPQDNAPNKTKWAMVIGIAAAVAVFAVAGVFLLKPASSPAAIHPPKPSPCCNPVPTTTPTADTQYLNEVDEQGGNLPSMSDSVLLSVGNAACSDFEDGNSVAETINDAASGAANNSYGIDDQDMAVILLAATSILCPAYGPQMQAYLNGNGSSD
jgi:Protein of unknown function (DUF732)